MKNQIKCTIRGFSRFGSGSMLLGMVFWITGIAAAEIDVNPDRNPIRLNESFILTFTADNSPDEEPDFSVLEQDFEILNQSQSSNISLINGDFSKSITWTLTLMARKAGHLFVPPVAFGRDHSRPFHLEVLNVPGNDSDDDSEILLEVSARPENPYVQAQVIYTVQLLRRVELAQASLSEPVLENSLIQKLGEDRSFSAQRNGHHYAVTERRYAMFPQQSGLLAIPPLELKADVVTSGRLGFFNQPGTRMRRIQSNPVALEVRPVPVEFKGDTWFPAEQVLLDEKWSNDPPSAQIGEPLTRTLKLTATGAPLSLLPDFGTVRFKEPVAGTLKQYPDQPVLEEKKYFSGIMSSREQKVALIPSNAGDFHSEAQEIAWWNTLTDRLEIARLPGITIKALPSTASASPNPGVTSSISDDRQKGLSGATAAISSGSSGGETRNSIWFWVSVFLGLGWSGTLIILATRKFFPKTIQKPEVSPETTSERHAIKALKMACRENAPSAAKDALIAWGGCHWPHSVPRNLAVLAAMCDATLADEIRKLSQSLYSREKQVWNGAGCWKAFSNYAEQQLEQKPKNRNVQLEPLFKA